MKSEKTKSKISYILLFLVLTMSGNIYAQRGTVYERFGGEEAIVAVVDQFLWNLADDERINEHFVETNIGRFRTKLIEMFCELTDGPCTYTGDNMEVTHRGMPIDDADFNATVEALIEAMESQNIPTGPQNQLLKRLAAFYAPIVVRKR